MSYYYVLVITTKQFSIHYDLTALQIGFCFLSQGGGTIFGSFIHGKFLDRDYKRVPLPPLLVFVRVGKTRFSRDLLLCSTQEYLVVFDISTDGDINLWLVLLFECAIGHRVGITIYR
jgi:hypothetical protein